MQVELEKAAAAAEKRRMAEQEKARLAAEKAKEIELAKAAAAEQVRAVPAENASTKRRATDEAADEDAAKSAAAKQFSGNDSQKLASLGESSNTALSPTELITSTQLELRRVGCLSALANGEWGIASQRSLALFNKYAGTQFDAKLASVDVLDAIKAKPKRVCPLICDNGFKADGDKSSRIVCKAGYEIGDDNTCERVVTKKPEKPVATREAPAAPKQETRPSIKQEKSASRGAGSCFYADCTKICHRNGGANNGCSNYCQSRPGRC